LSGAGLSQHRRNQRQHRKYHSCHCDFLLSISAKDGAARDFGRTDFSKVRPAATNRSGADLGFINIGLMLHNMKRVRIKDATTSAESLFTSGPPVPGE
jgi:hypothetical protein